MTTSLTYFDFDGSRGLECRLALTAAGVAFDDNRVNREQWAALKPTVPFGAMPVLDHNGRKLAQSTAILRYVGGTHAMHPADAWTAAEHDALMHSVEDLRHKMPGAGLSDDDKKSAREAFGAGWLTQWAATVEARIAGPFIEGATLNVADIKLYVILRAFFSNTYDHIPGSFFDSYPKIKALYAAVDGHAGIKAYFASR
jgi:prostaglandin-H2 D-isomerase / glutathione transferase